MPDVFCSSAQPHWHVSHWHLLAQVLHYKHLTTKFLVYVDVNLLVKNLNTTKKNADALSFAERKLV